MTQELQLICTDCGQGLTFSSERGSGIFPVTRLFRSQALQGVPLLRETTTVPFEPRDDRPYIATIASGLERETLVAGEIAGAAVSK